MTLLQHVQQTRSDVLWLYGPDQNGNYTWDQTLPNQSEIQPLIDSYDAQQAAIDQAIFFSIADRRHWAEDMMQRLKKMNYDANLSLAQSLWVHQRLRKLTFTVLQAHADAFAPLTPVVGMTFDIDLLNLVVSGDVETAYAALLCTTPDAMTEPYHALSQSMINWIMGEIASYLGWV